MAKTVLKHWSKRSLLIDVCVCAAILIGLAALSLVPPPYKLATGIVDNHGDHIIAYAAAAIAAAFLFAHRKLGVWTAVFLFGFAGCMEASQGLFPGRNPAWSDYLASVTGVCVGTTLSMLFIRLRRKSQMARHDHPPGDQRNGDV
ncbi:MAG: hypothetical protein WC807_15885 [Hyphomicrobium sp.]|jgi:VanZ family protein